MSHMKHYPLLNNVWAATLLAMIDSIYIIVYNEKEMAAGKIYDCGRWEGLNWVWDLKWRSPFAWEVEIIKELLNNLSSVNLLHREDCWVWKPHPCGDFTVRSAYEELSNRQLQHVQLSELQEKTLHLLWKSKAPLKVVVFSWQLLLDRIPSKVNLHHRRAIDEDASLLCVFCNCADESVDHLFLLCPFSKLVWTRVLSWLGADFAIPASIHLLIVLFGEGIGVQVKQGGCVLLWYAVVWCIWELRNGITFRSETPDFMYLMDRVKVLSWKWYSAGKECSNYSFFHWCIDPISCIAN